MPRSKGFPPLFLLTCIELNRNVLQSIARKDGAGVGATFMVPVPCAKYKSVLCRVVGVSAAPDIGCAITKAPGTEVLNLVV